MPVKHAEKQAEEAGGSFASVRMDTLRTQGVPLAEVKSSLYGDLSAVLSRFSRS